MNSLKRSTAHITGIVFLLLSFAACEQKDLFLPSPNGNIPVNVVIHWDSVPSNMLTLPRNMTVHWYPSLSRMISSDVGVYGGQVWLHADIFDVMCMDFHGPVTLAFRSNGTRQDFEVYNIRMTGLYNIFVPPLPGGEVTVAEAFPYQFYIDSRSQMIDTRDIPDDDTLTVNFYPKNVLREFTFMVYDVTGAQNIIRSSGAISGMSGSYFPATRGLASTPSTILFSRVEAIRNAQTSSYWTEQQKALFAAKNPNWASPDTLIGWTRDWITGRFATFGPLDTEKNLFRLTVEAANQGNQHYYGSWGYWENQRENSVAAQIDSAMGKNGTYEEQLAWRQRNGGFDIILYNDHRLTVSQGSGGGGSGGGFIVTVDDWGDIIEVPTAGSTRSAALRNASLRSLVNTYATISDFVVNGIHTETTNWSFIFNEQYVFKPESGLIWDYNPKRFWPLSGEVDFYAYAPSGIRNLVTGLNNNGDNVNPPVLEYTMSYKEREEPPPGTGEPSSPLVVDDWQEDLLVAVQNRPSPQTDAVPINFRHAFSRVTVRARTEQDYSNYRIKVVRVDLRNLYTSGKLQLNKDDTTQPVSTGIPMEESEQFRYGSPGVTLWYDLNTLANYRFRLITSAITIRNEYTTLIGSNDGVFVMPQVINAANNTAIYVEYDVYTYSFANGEQYYTSSTKLLPVTAGFAFEIGRQYELQVTLSVP
jgi:hypothetical protein